MARSFSSAMTVVTINEVSMKKREVALVVPCLAAVLAGPTPHAQTAAPTPPVAARKAHTTSIHGYTLTDDYFWLREKSESRGHQRTSRRRTPTPRR